MKKIIGLIALLVVSTGCPEKDQTTNNPRNVGIEKTIMIPAECQKLVTVGYQFQGGAYEVICENKDQDGTTNLNLYWKQSNDELWTAIHYRR